jgi:hypothetical protein
LLLATVPQSAADRIYKWVDDNGKVHFGDKPPRTDKAEEIRVRTQPGGDPDSVGRQQRTERILEALTAERQERNEARAAEREQRQERKRNCERAKHNVANYDNSQRMFRYDENGEIQYLDETERLAAGENARAAVRKWCK